MALSSAILLAFAAMLALVSFSGSKYLLSLIPVLSVIHSSASEFIVGSRMVDRGRDGDTIFLVVVMPKNELAAKALEARDSAITEVKENIRKAGSGNGEAVQDAREALLRAKAHDRQARSFDDIKESSDDLFKYLDAELDRL